MNRGLSVFCEKPLAHSVYEARVMQEVYLSGPSDGQRPSDEPPVPSHLNWDLWLGPAPYRPYHPRYLPGCTVWEHPARDTMPPLTLYLVRRHPETQDPSAGRRPERPAQGHPVRRGKRHVAGRLRLSQTAACCAVSTIPASWSSTTCWGLDD